MSSGIQIKGTLNIFQDLGRFDVEIEDSKNFLFMPRYEIKNKKIDLATKCPFNTNPFIRDVHYILCFPDFSAGDRPAIRRRTHTDTEEGKPRKTSTNTDRTRESRIYLKSSEKKKTQ